MARFRKSPVIVDAVRLRARVTIRRDDGWIKRAEPGDWLVTDVEGEKTIVTDDLFRATHEPLNDEARKMMGGE